MRSAPSPEGSPARPVAVRKPAPVAVEVIRKENQDGTFPPLPGWTSRRSKRSSRM